MHHVQRWTLAAFSGLCLVSTLTSQVVLATNETRQSTRLLFLGGFEQSAEVSIHYGAPTWREQHAAAIKGKRATHYRLGDGFWASLHTNIELQLGGKRVPASVWYLGLFRSAENKWFLSLMDASKLHRTGLTSGATRDVRSDLLVPMKLSTVSSKVEKLRIELTAGSDKSKPATGRLRLRWGPYRLEAELVAGVKLGKPVGEPKFGKFDPGRVTTMKSGLRFEELRPGVGKRPTATSTVTVRYVGWNMDGTRFDSTFQRNQPAKLRLNAVIKGWTEGLALMKPGAVFRFEIPPDLAYGKGGVGPIKPNSTLVFWVELLKIE